MDPAEQIGAAWKGAPITFIGVIHVLVKVRKVTGGTKVQEAKATVNERSAQDLAKLTMTPKAQLNIWKSVLKFSCEDIFSGTALVVDRTSTHKYLLTSLNLWRGETFADQLSEEFKTEIKRHERFHPRGKTSGKKRKSTNDDNQQLPRQLPRTAGKKVSILSGLPQVVVEQYLPNSATMGKSSNLASTATFAGIVQLFFYFAIFKIALPEDDVQLVPCRLSCPLAPPKHLYVVGFLDTVQDLQVDLPYAIIPVEYTGWSGTKMALSSLSAPELASGALVWTTQGTAVGYIADPLKGSGHERRQLYGTILHAVPKDLPSFLPPETD